MDTPQQYPTMWTTGYIGNVKVSFTFPIRNEMEAYAQAKAITDKLLADGFTTTEPGLEAGEESEMIGRVSRRNKKNNDNSVSPVIDLYGTNDALKYRIISIYLDTPEDVTAFENACGVKLASLPVNPTKAAVERDDENLVVSLPRSAKAILKLNPNYREDSEDKKPKRLFVRWEAANQAPPPAAQPAKPVFDGVNPPQAGDDEAELRRKAQAELDNEAVNIIEAFYRPSSNGMGLPRWEAKARLITGSTIRVVLWTEDVNLIKKAGYQWKDTDNEGIEIPVITKLVGSDRRIKNVLPMENPFGGKVAENANAWVFDLPALLMVIKDDTRIQSAPTPERVNVINAINREGGFEKVRNIDSAALMVVNRLMAHLAKRNKGAA